MIKKLICIVAIAIGCLFIIPQTANAQGLVERAIARRQAIRNLTEQQLVVRQQARLQQAQQIQFQKQKVQQVIVRQQKVFVQQQKNCHDIPVQVVQRIVVPQRVVRVVEVPKIVQVQRVRNVRVVEKVVAEDNRNDRQIIVNQQIRIR